MAQVRLKINMIINGKLHARGSVLDEALVPKAAPLRLHRLRPAEQRR